MIFFSLLFDSWQLTTVNKRPAGSPSDPPNPLSQQSPCLASCHFPKFVSIRHYSWQPTPTSPWSRTRQRPAWPGRCEIATTCGRLRWVPLTSHLKHPNPAPMTLSSTTIRLSKYNNQSRHSSPNLNLDRFAWRSSLSKLAVLSSIPFFFLSRYPYRPILLPSRSHLYTPFSLGCSRDRAPPPQSLPRPPRLVTYASAVS